MSQQTQAYTAPTLLNPRSSKCSPIPSLFQYVTVPFPDCSSTQLTDSAPLKLNVFDTDHLRPDYTTSATPSPTPLAFWFKNLSQSDVLRDILVVYLSSFELTWPFQVAHNDFTI